MVDSSLQSSSPRNLGARLGAFDTCAIADALDRLGLTGTASGLRPLWPGARLAGSAITVALGPADGRPADRHLAAAAVAGGAPGDVVVVANGSRREVGGWGGLLSRGARVRGIVGAVVDGACRDLDEIQQLGFPVFARGGAPLTARGRVREVASGVSVEIGGVSVASGDWVLADATGVVFVPAERAEEVLTAAAEIETRERRMAAALDAGESIFEVLARPYEELLRDGQ